MSRFIASLVMLTIICYAASAQYPDVVNNTPEGELSVYILNGDAESEITVDLTLDGPVYNDIGVYNSQVNINHPNRNMYGTVNLYGTSLTLYDPEYNPSAQTTGDWESVYRDDEESSTSLCAGMIGWGKYQLSFSHEGNVEVLNINTIDGNWMNGIYGNRNKIVIVDKVVSVGGGSYNHQFHYYNWTTSTWISIDHADNVFIWSVLGSSRNRSDIDALGDKEFEWPTGNYPLSVNSVIVDHHVSLGSQVSIAADKTVIFTDYNYEPTYVECYDKLKVAGTLIATTSRETDGYYGVYFIPTNIIGGVDFRKSWEGIEACRAYNDTTDICIDLLRACITKAHYGVKSEGNAPIKLTMCNLYENQISIFIKHTRMELIDSDISFSGTGLVLHGNLHKNGPSIVDGCNIHDNYPAGAAESFVGGWGICIGGEKQVITPVLPLERAIIIRDSRINYNWKQGISNTNGFHVVQNCEFAHNGYRFGRLFSDLKDGERSDGVWTDGALSVHYASNFTLNSDYGIHINGQTSHAHLRDISENEVIVDYEGKNCFDGNAVNVGANDGAHVYLGQIGRQLNPVIWSDHRNSFKFPRHAISGGYPKHFTAGNRCIIEASTCYFYPYASIMCESNDQDLQPGRLIAEFHITNPQEAVCPYSVIVDDDDIPGDIDDPDVILAKSHLSRLNISDSLWLHASQAFCRQLSRNEAGIITKAAHYLYRFTEFTDPLDSLERYAFTPSLSYSNVGSAALYSLIELGLQEIDSTRLDTALVSLMSVQEELYGAIDTVFMKMTAVKRALLIESDSAKAVFLLQELLEAKPYLSLAREMLFNLTCDTNIVTTDTTLEKSASQPFRPDDHESLRAKIFPSNIVASGYLEIVSELTRRATITVFNSNGERLTELYNGLLPAGFTYKAIDAANLPNGKYFCVIALAETIHVVPFMHWK